MPTAERVHRRGVEGGQAGQEAVIPPDRRGDGVEGLAGEPQLAGPVDPRMAGQHLLDQRGARARQAEDEDRLTRLVAGPGEAGEQLGREALDQPVDEPDVLGRVVRTVLLDATGQGHRVGPLQAGGRLGVVAA